MNIALTGSSGLIGSKLLDDLTRAGHKVLCISSSRSCHEENTFLFKEISDGKNFFKIDCFLHLASINSNLDQSQILEEVSLTHEVIKSMKLLGCKKLIFFSTAKVYGTNSLTFQQYTELSPLDPQCPYSIAKEKCEQAIAKMASKESFNYFILRLPPLLIYNSNSNIGKLFQHVKRGFPFPSFNHGDKNQRSFLSYELLFFAITKIVSGQSKIKEGTFNLAEPNAMSTNDLLRKMARDIGQKPKIIYFPNFIFHLMMRLNRLQLLIIRIYGNFNLSSKKFRDTFF